MRRFIWATASILIVSGVALGQQTPTTTMADADLSPGFKLRPVGDIDIGPAFAEVNYYSDQWIISQQHDKFEAAHLPQDATTRPQTRTISGVLSTANGPAQFKEYVTPVDGGIDFSATFDADKPLNTNELSETFILPKSAFAGKTIMIDGTSLVLSPDTPAKDHARLSEKDDAHTVVVPMPDGTLTLSGDFHFLIQDDQAWGDPRYSMRLYYTPGSGAITHSGIQLRMRLKPNN